MAVVSLQVEEGLQESMALEAISRLLRLWSQRGQFRRKSKEQSAQI